MREHWVCLVADKLQLCIEERQEIVKKEFEEQRLNEALDDLHLSVQSDLTSR